MFGIKRLTIYVCKTIINTSLIMIIAFSAIFIIFTYIEQVRSIGQGAYTATSAFLYVLYIIPLNLYNLMPFCALLGSLMGLGLLAGNSEITVMRASGMSTAQIAKGIVLAGVILGIFTFIMGGYIAPYYLKKSQVLLRMAKFGAINDSLFSNDTLWIKEEDGLVRIGQLNPETLEARDIQDFKINNKTSELDFIEISKQAEYSGEKNAELIHAYKVDMRSDDKIKYTLKDKKSWASVLPISVAKILKLDSQYLNFTEVVKYVFIKDKENTKSSVFLTFWQIIFQPISLLILMLIAVPFCIGSARSSSLGFKLIIGAVLGFMFYLLNQMFGPLSMVYKVPTFLSASIPSFIALFLLVFLFKKMKD